MRVTYIGTADPTDNGSVTVFGLTFDKNVPVEIDDVPERLRLNPTFVVEESKARSRRGAEPEA